MKTLLVNPKINVILLTMMLSIYGIPSISHGQDAPETVAQFSDRSLAILVRIAIAIDSQIPPNHIGLLEMPEVDVLKIPKAELTKLTRLTADRSAVEKLRLPVITDLTGLEFATNLTRLNLEGNDLSDISPLSGLINLTSLRLHGNNITDVSPLMGLTNLTDLHLGSNRISDVSGIAPVLSGLANLVVLDLHLNDISAVAGLTNLRALKLLLNNISDISPLVANTGLGSGAWVDLARNPLSYTSIYTHIPLLQESGVEVFFDNRIMPATLVKISGDQHGTPGAPLPKPLVVEVRDENGSALVGVPVTFVVTAGGGTLGVANTSTDANGRAVSSLTLGANPGLNTVAVSASGVEEQVTFTAAGRQGVIISDSNLRAAVGLALGKALGDRIVPSEIETLSHLDVPHWGIGDLTGLEFATNLTRLNLEGNDLTDISPVSGLTNLTWLDLGINNLSDISPVSGLINLVRLNLWNNPISDLSPLVANTGLGEGDRVNLEKNLLGYESIYTHIPTLQERGAEVIFDIRSHQRIRIVSGDGQQGLTGAALDRPFVVEVQDENRVAFEGVPVTFAATAGGGKLSATRTATDSNGRTESTLTLGPTPGTNTVTVSVTGIQEKQTFSAEGIRVPTTLQIISGADQEGLPGAVLADPFVVEVRDQADKPLPGTEVTFSVSSGGGTLSATNATTDTNGRAESTLTLGPNPGTNTVTISVTGIQEEQTFSAEGIRIPKTLEIISGDNQEGLPSFGLAKPFVVEVRDQSDKPLPGVEMIFSAPVVAERSVQQTPRQMPTARQRVGSRWDQSREGTVSQYL